ncbi:MAG: DUF3046 domain-containing protein [Actinobacteria bacterium]|nr:DUF3046 domain-containing protein [Actinomycetota bacterium]
MTLSRFHELVLEEFGEQFSQVVLRDTRLLKFEDKTPFELINAGLHPKDIWFAICDQWHGKTKTIRHAE